MSHYNGGTELIRDAVKISTLSMGTNEVPKEIWIDDVRKKRVAYEYLCHLQEAKEWLEYCLGESLPKPNELEEALRNGVILAKLAFFLTPELSHKKIYDLDLLRLKNHGLEFRHSDNINYWFTSLGILGLPSIFFPTLTDIYDKKNIPKLIYCLHALSHFLNKLGKTPTVKDLLGKIEFSPEEIDLITVELQKHNLQLPAFQKVGGILAKELNQLDSLLHTVVIAINAAIDEKSEEKLEVSLNQEGASVGGVLVENMSHYLMNLILRKKEKEAKDSVLFETKDLYDTLLNKDEIQREIISTNSQIFSTHLNASLFSDSHQDTFRALNRPEIQLCGLESANARYYHYTIMNSSAHRLLENSTLKAGLSNLSLLHSSKVFPTNCCADFCGPELCVFTEKSFDKKILNLASDCGILHSFSLGPAEVQTIIAQVNSAVLAKKSCLALSLQTIFRGNAVRKRHQQRLVEVHTLKVNIAAKQIQSWFRFCCIRKKYLARKDFFLKNLASIIFVQSWFRMIRLRSQFKHLQNYYRQRIREILLLQRWWLPKRASKHLKELLHSKYPSLACLRSFLPLLDHSNFDFQEDLILHQLKQKVTLGIRQNQYLENKLNIMDIKIGLLVKNRLMLTQFEAASKGSHLVHPNSPSKLAPLSGIQQEDGLQRFTKENQERIQNYQFLFYLLQTQPRYFYRLLKALPCTQATKLMDAIVLSVYNFSQTSREQYLFLKFFMETIREEVASCAEESCIFSENSLLVRLLVQYFRCSKERSFLKLLLHDFVTDILASEKYTQLVALFPPKDAKGEKSIKSQKGKPEKKEPFSSVHPNDETTHLLSNLCQDFVSTLSGHSSQFPYGIRAIAQQICDCLLRKFPSSVPENVCHQITNMIFHRFIFPAIKAPDAFDVVDVASGISISSMDRKILDSVANFLKGVASKSVPALDGIHAETLQSWHASMMRGFQGIFEPEEMERYFDVDKYSEFKSLSKPVVYLTPKEIYWTHFLLIQHLDCVAPLQEDALRIVLKDFSLHENWNLKTADFAGGAAPKGNSNSFKFQQEISLFLQDKFQSVLDEDHESKILFLETKRLLVQVMKAQPSHSLLDLLAIPSKKCHKKMFTKLALEAESIRKEQSNHLKHFVNDSTSEMQQPFSFYINNHIVFDLDEAKQIIRKNLNTLESLGILSGKNGHGEFLEAIGEDIRNRVAFRRERRREIDCLESASKSLQEKTEYYQSQDRDYTEYMRKCMNNMLTKPKLKAKKKTESRSFFSSSAPSTENSASCKDLLARKFSCEKLKKKGIISEWSDQSCLLPLSSVEFSSSQAGIFTITLRMSNTSQHSVEIHLDELLQMQFEGVTSINLFDHFRFHVELLIHLLNKIFFAK